MVALTNTLDPLRAHIARGVLEECGIPAFVRHESAAAYGPLACGGYDVMVEEEDLKEAGEILQAMPPTAVPEALERRPMAPLLLKSTVYGAQLFLLVALLTALPRLIHIIMSNTLNTMVKPLKQYLYELPSYLFWWMVRGALTGLAVGLLIWLLADFRRQTGALGRLFVGALATLLLVIAVLPGALGF
jgi:hypothetical protein